MKVTLYTTHCPQCVVLEEKLKQKGVEYDVIEDVAQMVEKGFMSAPVLEVDGTALNFGKANSWINDYKKGAE